MWTRLRLGLPSAPFSTRILSNCKFTSNPLGDARFLSCCSFPVVTCMTQFVATIRLPFGVIGQTLERLEPLEPPCKRMRALILAAKNEVTREGCNQRALYASTVDPDIRRQDDKARLSRVVLNGKNRRKFRASSSGGCRRQSFAR